MAAIWTNSRMVSWRMGAGGSATRSTRVRAVMGDMISGIPVFGVGGVFADGEGLHGVSCLSSASAMRCLSALTLPSGSIHRM